MESANMSSKGAWKKVSKPDKDKSLSTNSAVSRR